MCAIRARKVREMLAGTGGFDYDKACFILGFYTHKAGITPRFLRDSPKTRTISQLRDEIGEILAKETNLSLREIGEFIGRKHFRRPTNEKGK